MDDFTAIDAKARASFASQTMMQTLGAELIETAPGRCVIRAPIAAHLRQQHGAAHAGLAFTIGDSAAGYAALTLMAPETDVMTVEMKINLLSPAVGEALEAVGEVVRSGKRLTVVKAEVFALKGDSRKPIALMQGTMIPVAPA